HGSVTLNADGTFSYSHDGSETTSDSFTYKTCDNGTTNAPPDPNSDRKSAAKGTSTDTPVNDAPVANGRSATVAEGGTVTVLDSTSASVLANDTDAETNALTAAKRSDPAHGSVTLNANGTFSYSHDGSETTADSFTYKTCDNGTTNGSPDPKCSGTATPSTTVTPVNDAPVANNDSATVAEGGTVTVLDSTAASVLANDTDAEANTLTATKLSDPAHGSVTLNANGTFSYSHDGSETTTDSFTYKTCDNGTTNGSPDAKCSGTATPSTTVTPVNDAPVANNDSATVAEGGTVTVLDSTAASVLANDTDAEANTLTATKLSDPTRGSETLNANGTFSYSHDGSETTTDSFTYKTCDNGTTNGAPDAKCSGTATVSITVTPVNDAPVANNDSATVAEGGTVTVLDSTAASVLANDTDAEANTLTATKLSDPTRGSETLNANGTFSYSHDGSETTTDSFTYKTCDNGTTNGAPDAKCSGTATVSITVTPVNDPPVANNDSATVAEGGTVTVLDSTAASVLANDTDAEANTLTATKLSDPTRGSETLNANGTFSYSHDGSETTTDSFTYKTCDNGTTNGAPDAKCSGTATVSITVTPVNDPPVANNDSATVAEGGTVTVLDSTAASVLANDTDAEANTLTATKLSDPAHGSVTLNADGTFSYSHDGSETTTDSFTYKTCDNGTTNGSPDAKCSGTATVSITVTPVNDAPAANNDSATVAEGGTVTVLDSTAASVLANDTDAEGNTLTATKLSDPVHGSVTLNADGTFSYSHDGSEPTSHSFTSKTCDNGTTNGSPPVADPKCSATATVSITVTPVNDAPVANNDSATVAEGGTVTVLDSTAASVLANDTDAEANTLTATKLSDPAHGSVTLNADGTFSYSHDGSETTSDSFTYKTCDNGTTGSPPVADPKCSAT